MEKIKIHKEGDDQVVYLPRKYQFDSDEILFQEHELGVLLIDPKKRFKAMDKVVGSMEGSLFPEGRDLEQEDKRNKIR